MSILNKHKDILLKEFYLDEDGSTVRRAKDGWRDKWKKDDVVVGYKLCSYGYLGVHVPKANTTVNLTHLILLLRGIEIPNGMVVDHIDGNTINNSPENLRITTQALNCRNRKMHCNNTIGYTGITFNKASNSYLVRLTVDKKRIYLGHCFTLEDALVLRNTYLDKRKQDGYTSRHGLEASTTIP